MKPVTIIVVLLAGGLVLVGCQRPSDDAARQEAETARAELTKVRAELDGLRQELAKAQMASTTQQASAEEPFPKAFPPGMRAVGIRFIGPTPEPGSLVDLVVELNDGMKSTVVIPKVWVWDVPCRGLGAPCMTEDVATITLSLELTEVVLLLLDKGANFRARLRQGKAK
jgi:hypothetical protein